MTDTLDPPGTPVIVRQFGDANRRYRITSHVSGRQVGEEAAADPFHVTRVVVSWRDALRSLLRRGHLVVQVRLDADAAITHQVMSRWPGITWDNGRPVVECPACGESIRLQADDAASWTEAQQLTVAWIDHTGSCAPDWRRGD